LRFFIAGRKKCVFKKSSSNPLPEQGGGERRTTVARGHKDGKKTYVKKCLKKAGNTRSDHKRRGGNRGTSEAKGGGREKVGASP